MSNTTKMSTTNITSLFFGDITPVKSGENITPVKTGENTPKIGDSNIVSSKADLSASLRGTKVCLFFAKGKECPHQRNGRTCNFSHSKEVNVLHCLNGSSCFNVRADTEIKGVYHAISSKICPGLHEGETHESRAIRMRAPAKAKDTSPPVKRSIVPDVKTKENANMFAGFMCDSDDDEDTAVIDVKSVAVEKVPVEKVPVVKIEPYVPVGAAPVLTKTAKNKLKKEAKLEEANRVKLDQETHKAPEPVGVWSKPPKTDIATPVARSCLVSAPMVTLLIPDDRYIETIDLICECAKKKPDAVLNIDVQTAKGSLAPTLSLLIDKEKYLQTIAYICKRAQEKSETKLIIRVQIKN